MAKYALLIGGKSFAASAYSVVRNPSTGEAVGEMPLASKVDLEAAVSAAKLAFICSASTSIYRPSSSCPSKVPLHKTICSSLWPEIVSHIDELSLPKRECSPCSQPR